MSDYYRMGAVAAFQKLGTWPGYAKSIGAGALMGGAGGALVAGEDKRGAGALAGGLAGGALGGLAKHHINKNVMQKGQQALTEALDPLYAERATMNKSLRDLHAKQRDITDHMAKTVNFPQEQLTPEQRELLYDNLFNTGTHQQDVLRHYDALSQNSKNLHDVQNTHTENINKRLNRMF